MSAPTINDDQIQAKFDQERDEVRRQVKNARRRTQTQLNKLGKTLFTFGGNNIHPIHAYANDLDRLISSGYIMKAESWPILMVEQHCHENVAKLWFEGKIVQIGTGMAKSGSTWFEHSWGVSRDGTIIETTRLWETYFGYTMSGEEADEWAYEMDSFVCPDCGEVHD